MCEQERGTVRKKDDINITAGMTNKAVGNPRRAG